MTTSEHAKRIIFYGDSLVYGKQSGASTRLGPHIRYTGVLQSLLGDDFEVIEEGLRARTLCGENPFFPERDGLAHFSPIIGSQLPADMLVIALGTNNCNQRPDFDAKATAACLQEYFDKLKAWVEFMAVPLPLVLIMLPPDIVPEYYDEGSKKIFGPEAGDRVKQLRQALATQAAALGLPTLDASEFCRPAQEDGIHLDGHGNQQLAEALLARIIQAFAV